MLLFSQCALLSISGLYYGFVTLFTLVWCQWQSEHILLCCHIILKVCYYFLSEACYPSVDCIMEMSRYSLSLDANDKVSIKLYFVVLSSLEFKVCYFFLSELLYPLVEGNMDLSRYSFSFDVNDKASSICYFVL